MGRRLTRLQQSFVAAAEHPVVLLAPGVALPVRGYRRRVETPARDGRLRGGTAARKYKLGPMRVSNMFEGLAYADVSCAKRASELPASEVRRSSEICCSAFCRQHKNMREQLSTWCWSSVHI